ncbi:MAG: PcfB family protein [Oscillospiraceae bacterium]|jgi:hypothetical protein|nr:PcfB family protein [Oscillospiraceae bacterium]
MPNGGEAAEQVVRISLDGIDYAIRIAGTGAKQIAALIMAALKSKKSQPTTLKVSGAERLKRMLKSEKPLDVFSVREQDIKAFMTEAKKYGIVYCAIRDKEPKADGMIDVLVRKEDSPKIDRVMERLQYGAVDKTSIKSKIVRTKAEQSAETAEPSAPDKSDTLDVDSFLDSIMPDEGKSKEGQNQAVQPPAPTAAAPEKAKPEVSKVDFLSPARTKQNPSARGSDGNSSVTERTTNEPPSVKEEISAIRTDLKKEAAARKDEPQRGSPQQTTRHQQPQNTRKSKNHKER